VGGTQLSKLSSVFIFRRGKQCACTLALLSRLLARFIILVGPQALTRSQSYDFWIYSYNASVVVPRLQRFSMLKKYFCFQNEPGYTWRCKNLQRWAVNRSRRIGSRVTSLDKFSSIVRLFNLAGFFKMKKVDLVFGPLFSTAKVAH
jgi:hypothetical protein